MSATDTTTAPSKKPASAKAMAARIAALEAELAAERGRVAELTKERDTLRASYDRLRLDLELLQRRIVVGKAERVDTAQLELEFATKLAALDALSAKLDGGAGAEAAAAPAGGAPSPPLVVARVKYRVAGAVPETTTLATAPMPAETFPRSLAAPSLLARIIVEKYLDGMPLHRQEDRLARDGVRLDRGTMCRWVEDAGATAGATVIVAARDEAMRTAFCIATDATGVLVQPMRSEQSRQPCRRGHYLVQIADRDHVFFEYLPRETSAAIGALFKGFTGYIQADAKSVYDALFRPPEDPPPAADADGALRSEVGCWSHRGPRRNTRTSSASVACSARRSATWSGRRTRSRATSRTAASSWTTIAASASCAASRSVARPGSLSAVTTTPRAQRTSSRSSPRPAFTASIPRPTCATSSVCSRPGRAIGTSS